MDETITRLRAANPVSETEVASQLDKATIDRARAKTAELAASYDAVPVGASSPGSGRRRVAVWGILILALSSLTPPVQALAERMGELVGIGDEPSRAAQNPIDEPAIVIGAGEAPNGAPYEVVATADPNIYYDEDPTTCIGMDLPSEPGMSHAGCLTGEHQSALEERSLSPIAFLGPEGLGERRLIVDGLAHSRVAGIEVEHLAQDGAVTTYPAELSRLDDELAGEIGAPERAGFFASFLPDDLVPPFDPDRPIEPEEALMPAPAPGTITGRGPVIPPEDWDASLREEWIDTPADHALARISVVAYDAAGIEVGRQSVLRGPYSDLGLYAGLQGGEGGGPETLGEGCFGEALRRFGEPGEIPPQLPPDEVRDAVDACERSTPR